MLKWTILFLAVGIKAAADECPPISNSSSGRNVLMELTEPCRYDMWERPQPENGSTKVSTRIYVYFLGSVEVQHLHFTAHILIRFRWYDPRLVHNSTGSFQGENDLKTRLWTPHIYIVNEHDSQVMGVNKEDTLITVQPDGNVLYSKRLKVTLLCLMELQKFPFDEQKCPLVLESCKFGLLFFESFVFIPTFFIFVGIYINTEKILSLEGLNTLVLMSFHVIGMYNTTQLVLSWEKHSPVIVNRHLQMTEYNLVAMWTNVSDVVYSVPEQASSDMDNLHLYGKFAGTYSSLTVYFQLEREVGHYIMDYYVPSILLVVVSWVSFWLDPNAVPGRTTLGTSTMLTFITLSRNTGSSLPKVSYIKATEIWFIVCTGFIFGSLVEFAFVNTIWRRRNNIELKKVNSKHILKSTLTPQQKRRLSTHDSRSGSLPSMLNGLHNQLAAEKKKNKSDINLSTLDNFSCDPFPSVLSKNVINIQVTPCDGEPHAKTFFTMTPQEIAQWIDRRSRLFFPLAFLVFNCFYWIFVWL